MFKASNILVPTDFSDHSDKALKQALEIAQQSKAKIHLLHVVHDEIRRCAADYCLTDELLQQFETGMLSSAQESLKKQLAKFPEAKQVEVIPSVRKGFPSEEIIKEQEEKKIDLVVIAPLGRTGIAKYLVGSVTKNVVREAKCPVLVAK
jgi:universal stress protein A